MIDFRDFCATFLGGQEDGLVHVQMQKKNEFSFCIPLT